MSGFVLDRRFGLDQGFAFYDSPFSLHGHAGQDSGDIKRPGAKVIESATQWLESHPNQTFFLFVHLYDLHTPYLLPPSWRPRSTGSKYDTELQYVDEVLGDFWERLLQVKNGLPVVILADPRYGKKLLGLKVSRVCLRRLLQGDRRGLVILRFDIGNSQVPNSAGFRRKACW